MEGMERSPFLTERLFERELRHGRRRNADVCGVVRTLSPAAFQEQKWRGHQRPAHGTGPRGEQRETRDFVGHKGCVNAVAFSPTGSHLLSGSDDTTVKLWDVESRKCLRTLPGHVSNVFATEFLPHKCEMEYVSGGNEADIRYWQLGQDGSAISTVYKHHTRKVLRISVLPHSPDVFLSCSADSTVRIFDTRVRYGLSETNNVPEASASDAWAPGMHPAHVVPQALGGGRHDTNLDADDSSTSSSLVLAFTRSHITVYSVECHPLDGRSFVIACEDGCSRLYDLRHIPKDPYDCLNTYANVSTSRPDCESTGCTFSWDGSEIAVSNIGDNIYLYDTDRKFDVNYNCSSYGVTGMNSSIYEIMRHVAIRTARGEDGAPMEYSDSDEEDSDSDDESMLRLHAALRAARELQGGEEGEAYDPFLDEDEEMEESEHTAFYDLRSSPPESDDDTSHDALLRSMPDVPSSPPDHTYKAAFTDHISIRTIKGLGFYGTRSEYIMTGSDDACIYLWEKRSGNLAAVLTGHESIVNNVLQHPTLPAIVSSGIDDVVKLWALEDLHDKTFDPEEVLSRRGRERNIQFMF
mmetsp:Transcript_13178/g.52584  ORF Transcript_13178/g.52584 Transcript_13178/m.52584 type:complete len:579 (+) Transcript_13178:47-1783(+)